MRLTLMRDFLVKITKRDILGKTGKPPINETSLFAIV